MNDLFLFFAEQAPAEPAGFSMLVPLLLFGGFWFLMIAPQRKKQKKHAQMLASLTSGDEVVAVGGIYGTITNVKEDRYVLKVADSTKIEVMKSGIQSRVADLQKDTKKK